MEALKSWGFFAAAAVAGVAWLVVSNGDEPAYALIPGLAAALFVCAGIVQRHARAGIIATAALNLGCSWYLFQQKLDASGAGSACNIDEVFNCDLVNSSEYSVMFGLPITLLGAGTYAGILAAALTAKRGEADDGRFDHGQALVAAFSVAYSLFLGWASLQLGAFCVVCITMYVGNAILLWAGFRALAERGERFGGRGLGLITSPDVLTMIAVGVIVVVAGRPAWDAATDPMSGATTASGATDWAKLYTEPCADVALEGTEPMLGSSTADIVIVEWADFGCPHCARAGKELKDLLSVRPELQVRFKPFPLSGVCNPGLDDDGDPSHRCDAAYAAQCAHDQGAFWPMSDQLFTNQGYFERDQLRFMAKEIGLDLDAFDSCLDDPATHARVSADAAAGDAVCIRGTPALFVKGLTGDGFVEITAGVPAILKLVEAKGDGVSLPAPGGS